MVYSCHFSDIGDGIKTAITQSQQQFKEATIQASTQFDVTMTKAQENLNHMTGGNTYPVVVPSPLPANNSQNTFELMLSARGTNPLFDVTLYPVRQLPLPKEVSAAQLLSNATVLFSAASLSPNRALILPARITPSLNGESDYQITSVVRNGVFFETLHIRKNGDWVKQNKGLVGPWEYSYEITRNGKTFKKEIWRKTFFSGARLTPQP